MQQMKLFSTCTALKAGNSVYIIQLVLKYFSFNAYSCTSQLSCICVHVCVCVCVCVWGGGGGLSSRKVGTPVLPIYFMHAAKFTKSVFPSSLSELMTDCSSNELFPPADKCAFVFKRGN